MSEEQLPRSTLLIARFVGRLYACLLGHADQLGDRSSPSFSIMRPRCTLTVFSAMSSLKAICLFSMPEMT